jgi:hypothetical protein
MELISRIGSAAPIFPVGLRAYDPQNPRWLRIAVYVRETLYALFDGGGADDAEEPPYDAGPSAAEPGWLYLIAELAALKVVKLAITAALVGLLHTQLHFCCASGAWLGHRNIEIVYGSEPFALAYARLSSARVMYFGSSSIPIILTLCPRCYLPLQVEIGV